MGLYLDPCYPSVVVPCGVLFSDGPAYRAEHSEEKDHNQGAKQGVHDTGEG